MLTFFLQRAIMLGVKQSSGALRQVSKTGRGLPPVRRGAHVGCVPVLCLRGPPQDPHRHAHHHLQQDPGKPQQHVEIRQTVPHHSGKQTTKS